MNEAEEVKKKEHVLLVLFVEFFKMGMFTIGGGLAMIPLIEDLVVRKKKWMSEEETLECITISQSLPGVVAINMATYIGYRKAGFRGATCALLGVTLPSFLIILALAGVVSAVDDIKFVNGMFIGIKACVTGLVAVVAFDLARKLIGGVFTGLMAVFAFISVVLFDISAIIIVIIAGSAGAVLFSRRVSRIRDAADSRRKKSGENRRDE